MSVTENRIEELAAGQHGVVSRSQLLGAGLGPGIVDRRIDSGRLRCIHRGVYRVGPLVAPRSLEMAAVLACGPGARVSHRNAGWLLGITPRPPVSAPVEVTVPARRVVRRPGIRVYRAALPQAGERTTIERIPVTSSVRTLVDLARVLPSRDLERAAARAERKGLITMDGLAELVERNRRRPGVQTLAVLLAQDGGPALRRSLMEDRFADAIEVFGLPRPVFNIEVRGHELDCFWKEAQFAVELDGKAYHTSWQSQVNDRSRDADLAAGGIDVMRITWKHLVHERERTMMKVGRALVARGLSW